MTGLLRNHVGALDLLDLNFISQFHGGDFLPYPFMVTHRNGSPPRFATQDEASAYTSTIPDRFNYGDLRMFTECMNAYRDADIRVTYHVQHIPADTPSVRVVAFRAGERGFFGAQRPDADVVDFYTVSPYDLGAAIADAAGLTQPGSQARVVVPAYVPRRRVEFDTGGVVVGDRAYSTDEVLVSDRDVFAYATVQSDWRRPRQWGRARDKPSAVWIGVHDDGDYLYTADGSYAQPVTAKILRERIDQLIAEDVEVLRELRAEVGG